MRNVGYGAGLQDRAQARRDWKGHRDGSSGPASECRRISPVDGTVIEVIDFSAEIPIPADETAVTCRANRHP